MNDEHEFLNQWQLRLKFATEYNFAKPRFVLNEGMHIFVFTIAQKSIAVFMKSVVFLVYFYDKLWE